MILVIICACLPIDPQTRYFFPDGSAFDLCRDWARTANELARLEPDAVAGYLRFLAYAADIRQMRGLGFASGESLASARGRPALIRAWLRAGPFLSAYSASRRFVPLGKNCVRPSPVAPFTAAAVPTPFPLLIASWRI